MALARALAVEPQVMLLDEPFGALDAKVRKELRDWLRRLHDEVHVTTVFVTHDQEEAMEVADEIVVINNGRSRADRHARPAVRPSRQRLRHELPRAGHRRWAARRCARTTSRSFALPSQARCRRQWSRLVRLGFEVRVDALAGDQEVWVQISRGECRPARSRAWR